jgi:hypothetical protein
MTQSDRRHSSDRRTEPTPSRRTAPPSQLRKWVGIAGRDLAIILGTLLTIVFSVRSMNPIFANSPTVVQSLTKAVPKVAATVLNPSATTDTSTRGRIVGTPEFERDRKAFAEALVKTKQVPQVRADSIAYYAVREAYINHIPPAVLFGVMLTENSRFISGAMSDVGAVGLMQIYPKVWLKALSDKFGKDLAADSTNIKYGAYILRSYIKSDSGAVSQSAIGKGLLRYNGCVRGTHTPHCTNYPSKVARYVESLGGSICGDKGFYACIAKPFVSGLFGKKDEQPTAVQ